MHACEPTAHFLPNRFDLIDRGLDPAPEAGTPLSIAHPRGIS